MQSPKSTFALLILAIASLTVLTAQAQQTKQKKSATNEQASSSNRSKTTDESKVTGPRATGPKATGPKATGSKTTEPKKVVRTEKEWRKLLSREQYRVLRGKGTERAFRNKYDKHFKPGQYACAACDQVLFASNTKFNSGCGWPAFYASMAGDRVILQPDYSNRMLRTEVICARCNSHLGHVFKDAPMTPTGNRFCINSVSLKFIPAESDKKNAASSRGKSRDSETTPSKRSARAKGDSKKQ